jgi:hypothetical protein
MKNRHLIEWSETGESTNVFAERDLKQYRLDLSSEALRPYYDYWSVSIHDSLTGVESNWYSVGDWSKQLVHGSQGNLSLRLQHGPPESGTDNWIQTPKEDFIAIVHLYDLPAGEVGTVSMYKFASSVRFAIISPPPNRMDADCWQDISPGPWH